MKRKLESIICKPDQKLIGRFVIALTLIAAMMSAFAVESNAAGHKPRPALITVAPAVEKTVSLELEFVGTSRARRTSRVASEVEGRVKKVHFSPGDFVKIGSVLVELDETSYRISLTAAQAMLSSARLKLAEARKRLKRSISLKKAKTISIQNYENTLLNVWTLEQETARAEAETARLENRISRMKILAPFNGYILSQNTEIGQWAAPGSVMVTLIDLSKIKVQIFLPERYLESVRTGDSAIVTFPALGYEKFTGSLKTIMPSAANGTRSLPAEIVLSNKSGRIKAGLSANVVLKSTPHKALLIPKDALILNQHKTTVYVVNQGKARPVTVQTGESYGNDIEIKGLIKPGQLVVVKGNERLRPGQAVKIVE